MTFWTRVLLCLALVAAGCQPRERATTRIDAAGAPVIIVSIDTLRADHLPAYGYGQGRTPHLDAFRKDAILFRHAYAHAPLTLPSHVSILTGLLPPDHGVRDNIGFRLDATKHATIPTLLKARGYATGAAVSAYVLRGSSGLGAAFDFYNDDVPMRQVGGIGNYQRAGDETRRVAEEWISAHASQPFFFLLHLFEPHTPYEPGPEGSGLAPYDGEIATADAILGRFLESLRRAGLYDRAVIIVLSDHGEGLGDHGEDEHGIFLYREAIHVPLLLKLPAAKMAGTTVDEPVQLIDVLPTIAALTGAQPPAPMPGRSLLERNDAARRIYSESFYARIHLGWSELRSLIDDRFHYIDAPRPELYAIEESAEKVNVLAANRRVASAMRTALEPFSRELPRPEAINPEEAKKLAALGYLSATAEGDGPRPDPKDRIGELQSMKRVAVLDAEGRRGEAIALLRELVRANPKLTDAWSLLGKFMEESGQFEAAASMYEQGVRAAPNAAGEMALSLANVYLMLNRPDQAAQHAELGMHANPGQAHLISARAALAKGDLQAAASEAQQAMQSFSHRPAALVVQAEILQRQRRLPEALDTVNRALAITKADALDVPPLLQFVRGDILARMNRAEEAIAAFKEEIRLYPHDRQAYANLAVVYLLTGRRAEANETMERLVRANPDRAARALAVETFERMRDSELAERWRRGAISATN